MKLKGSCQCGKVKFQVDSELSIADWHEQHGLTGKAR